MMSSRPAPLAILVFLLLGHLNLSSASGANERYFLNDHEALLYKVINWWYHADPEEAAGTCGTVVRVAADTPSTISHDPDAGQTIVTFLNFAELVSPGKNTLYGGTGKGQDFWEIELSEGAAGNRLLVKYTAGQTNLVNKGLSVELQGTILGLRDGRVSLYTAEDNLYNCLTQPTAAPIQLRIFARDSPNPLTLLTLSGQEW